MKRKNKKEIFKRVMLSLVSASALSYYFQVSTGSMAGIVFLFGFLCILTYVPFLTDRRAKICAKVASVICSISLVLGKVGRSSETILDALSRYDDNLIKNAAAVRIGLSGYHSIQDILVLSVTFTGIGIVCYYIILKMFEIMGRIQLYDDLDSSKQYGWKAHTQIFIIILICWIPYFILNYPGVLTYDSLYQIAQTEGDVALNDHHPAIHTAFIDLTYHFGKKIFGTSNAGIAFYLFIQMSVMAFIESGLVLTLMRSNLKKIYVRSVLLYFALIPLHALYAVTMWKDILFGGFLLWFCIVLYEIYIFKKDSGMIWLQYILSGSLMALFRSNGIIVFILCLPFLVAFIKRSVRHICLILLPVCIFGIVKGPVYHAFHVQSANMVESLSMPLQHIARVAVNCEDELTAWETELIERAAPLEDIKDAYNCRFADPLKNLVSMDAISEHKLEYLKLWVLLGVKHPVQYVLAELDATVGYWHPDEQYSVMINVIDKNDYGIFSIWEQKEDMCIFLRKWYNLYRKVPILGNFFSIGTVFLLTVLCMIKNIYDKQYKRLVPSLPSLMNWVTIMIAAPVFAEMRYVYGMMLAIPLIFFQVFLPQQENKIVD